MSEGTSKGEDALGLSEDSGANACFLCLDRHVRDGRGDQAAVIYDAPVISFSKTITYAELLDEVVVFAAVLADFGVGSGDAVLLHLPMIPRAHVAVLACARLGAVAAVAPADDLPADLAARLDAVRPKVLLTASCIVAPDRVIPLKPTVDAALDRAAVAPDAVLVWQRPRCEASMMPGRDHDWEALIEAAEGEGRSVACAPVAATDALLLEFATAAQGGFAVMRRSAGEASAALASRMRTVYGVEPGEVFWCAADVGSTRGLCDGVLAPLLIGAATVCFEGDPVGTPDAGAFWRLCDQRGVVALVAPAAAIRAIAESDREGVAAKGHDLTRLRAVHLYGPDLDTSVAWARRHLVEPHVVAASDD